MHEIIQAGFNQYACNLEKRCHDSEQKQKNNNHKNNNGKMHTLAKLFSKNTKIKKVFFV